MNNCPLPSNKRPKREKEKKEKRSNSFYVVFLERERVWLLSKITGDPTVRFLWSKKESRSTQ